jgi:predicted nucleic acid-binding protein
MSWLLDTNVLSELKRTSPSQRVVSFLAACSLDQLYITTVTLAEIRF